MYLVLAGTDLGSLPGVSGRRHSYGGQVRAASPET